jgi:hypothetical protein
MFLLHQFKNDAKFPCHQIQNVRAMNTTQKIEEKYEKNIDFLVTCVEKFFSFQSISF